MVNEYKIKIDKSKNNFASDFVEYTFNKEYIDTIFNELYNACKDKFHYESAYQYDKDAMQILKNNILDVDLYKPIIQLLIDLCNKNITKYNFNNWYDPYVSMRRTLEVFFAFSHPGFIEARNNQLD
jgi:hypothetical protein